MWRGLPASCILSILIGSLVFMSGGCATESSGVAAYKRGEYSDALKEFRSDGSPEGDFAIGVMYFKGEGVKKNLPAAITYFRRAADGGHAAARYNMGLLCLQGKGVPRDPRIAAEWFLLSSEQGFAKAQYNLGLMYSRGEGVKKDRRAALRWLARSARQGNQRAMNQLKVMLAQR